MTGKITNPTSTKDVEPAIHTSREFRRLPLNVPSVLRVSGLALNHNLILDSDSGFGLFGGNIGFKPKGCIEIKCFVMSFYILFRAHREVIPQSVSVDSVVRWGI